MKKILIIFAFIITFSNYAFACACIGEIAMIFNQITSYTTQNVSAATANTSILIKQILNNTEKIKEENQELNKLLEAEKLKSVEGDRLIFLLKKTIELNNLE